ncbi:MAG: hypothetical protein COB85_08105 [Bacteroidetes bacterium]|nr:MAG: hypothetical protein COB85_08105 [Bacteroidota bacterium]
MLLSGISIVNPDNYQIFYKGKEIPIYVHGDGDGSFDAGDYIEFYGERNTGWLDTTHFVNPNWHGNPDVSFYTDTSIYFLTWNTTGTGKRLTAANATGILSFNPSSYYKKKVRNNYTASYYGGKYTLQGEAIYHPAFTEGQGLFSLPFTDASVSYSINTPNVFTSGPSSEAELVLVGANLSGHSVQVSFGDYSSVRNNAAVNVEKLNFTISTTSLGSSSSNLTLNAFGSSPDRNALAYLEVIYPHNVNLNGASTERMIVPDDIAQAKTRYDLTNFTDTSAIVYDLTNGLRITTIIGTTLQVLIPNSGGDKICYLSAESSISSISSLTLVGSTGYFTRHTKFPRDSAYVIISHSSLWTNAKEYAYYRGGILGGSHDTLLLDIDELYDQFAFGAKKHPMAIRGFFAYAIDSFSSPPKFLLLLGKSITYRYSRSGINYSNNLVPTYGWPPSDNLLTAGLGTSEIDPAIATGRIAAKSNEEIEWYLNKIEEHDLNPALYPINPAKQILSERNWMKQILHFGGGSNDNEQSNFRNYLKGYEKTIEDTLFGGYVHKVFKNSPDPIQNTISDSITKLINDGVSIMTFFGHASGSGFDQNIDYPDFYTNTNGRYPLLIANSCLVGDIHKPVSSTTLSNSEEWVLHKKGVIGFLASVSYGLPVPLDKYTSELYKNFSNKNYGKGIGVIIQETIKAIQIQTSVHITCLEMTLHGDPAMVLNPHRDPDYTITYNDVYTTPTNVTSELDSFDLHLIISNIGRATNQSIGITVRRRYPSAETQVADPDPVVMTVPYIPYKDTITFRFPVSSPEGVGINRFDIRIDPSLLIDEISDKNNDLLNFPIPINAQDLIPIYPYEYSVIPEQLVTLKASTGNAFAKTENYKFELDTTDLFISPLASTVITHSGGVVEWDPAFDPSLNAALSIPANSDTLEYFWRTRRDSTTFADSNHIWRESSFQFIEEKKGWGQSHFFQFKKDAFNLIDYNRTNRTFDFVNSPKQLHCTVIGNAWNDNQYSATEYKIDGTGLMSSSCGAKDAIIVVVIDPVSLQPWNTQDYNFGQINNPGYGVIPHYNAFVFRSEPQNSGFRANLANMLNSIPDSNYILIYTFMKMNFKEWEDTLFNAFQTLGSIMIVDSVNSPANNAPYILFIKKGDLSTLQEDSGNAYDTLNLYANIKTNYDFGYFSSTIVGPSTNWGSIHWKVDQVEPNDNVRLEVTGIDFQGNETIITQLANLPPDSTDIYNLNSIIPAATYPQLRLKAFIKDSLLKTPAQLKNWYVLFDGVPEAAINPSIYYSFESDTLEEGEMVKLNVVVNNVSEYDMDSLLISYWIVDQARSIRSMSSQRYKPLLKSPDSIMASITYSTSGFAGINSIWIEANPADSTGVYDQLEQYHFNNIAELSFFVKGDKTNPLLDVTFDGVHILDRDIVSAKPQIVIQLNDENRYLALNNDSVLQVYIKRRGDSGSDNLIPYDNNILTFIPAKLPANKAQILYNPEKFEDGIYELRIQAKDMSQNSSGDLDYSISFEVINKPTITEIFNYPNPFSTSTRFVFTLTGSEVPQDFRIRIFTITGRVVKEIFSDELGTIHIGNNLTEYAWDGTDQYGDRLANGVYLYTVDVKLNGQDLEKRETAADKFIHKGFGKMYLMR